MPAILLPIDLSVRSDRAIRRATILARASGAGLHLLHVVPEAIEPGQVQAGVAPPPTVGELQGRLIRIAEAIVRLDGVECSSRLAIGDPIEQITLAAEDLAVSLIVTGPHKPRLRNLIGRATVEKLCERCPVPVLIANALPAGGYLRILAPTGLDALSAQVLRQIGSLPLGGPHELFTVYIREPAPGLRFDSRPDRDDHRREALEAAHTELSAFLEANELMGEVRPHVRLNRSTLGHEIEGCAAELGCDLIAIGSSQKPFLEKLLVGSVAEAVVREVDADILVFP